MPTNAPEQTATFYILDLEVEMVNNKAVYIYYRNEMANFRVVSAMPFKKEKDMPNTRSCLVITKHQ